MQYNKYYMAGCLLTSGNLTHGQQYYNLSSCSQVFHARSNIVFLVHGFYPSLWKDSVSWLWDFYDIKDRILEDDASTNNTVVIIVNWTKVSNRHSLSIIKYLSFQGSEVHFGLFLKDVLEGIIGKLTETMTNFAPIISQVIKDITTLGKYTPDPQLSRDRGWPYFHKSKASTHTILDYLPLDPSYLVRDEFCLPWLDYRVLLHIYYHYASMLRNKNCRWI